MRITQKTLATAVDNYNKFLEEMGAIERFEHQPRNGYQAVDLTATTLKEGCCIRNIACGTPRQVLEAVERAFISVSHDCQIRQKEREIQRLQSRIAELSADGEQRVWRVQTP